MGLIGALIKHEIKEKYRESLDFMLQSVGPDNFLKRGVYANYIINRGCVVNPDNDPGGNLPVNLFITNTSWLGGIKSKDLESWNYFFHDDFLKLTKNHIVVYYDTESQKGYFIPRGFNFYNKDTQSTVYYDLPQIAISDPNSFASYLLRMSSLLYKLDNTNPRGAYEKLKQEIDKMKAADQSKGDQGTNHQS